MNSQEYGDPLSVTVKLEHASDEDGAISPEHNIDIHELDIKKEWSEDVKDVVPDTHVIYLKEFIEERVLNTQKLFKPEGIFHNCGWCHKSFRYKQNLMKHESTHSGEIPYSCYYCCKVSNDKSNMKKEKSIHLGEKTSYTSAKCRKMAGSIDSDDSDLEFEATGNISESEDFVEVQDEVDSDMEASEEDEETLFTSTNELQWSSLPPLPSGRRASNIPTEDSGLRNSSINVCSIKDMFCLFINEEMVKVIIEETNRHLNRIKSENNQPISKDELYAFIGILLASGRNPTQKLSLCELWISEIPFCQPFFTAALNRDRFIYIYSNIRFDDKETREERYQVSSDKLEPIKCILKMFVDACKSNYSPSSNITVDERLASFRGNCPFRVYMKSKPGKYGIKIWVAADSATAYITNLQVYSGMINNHEEINQGHRVVMEMVQPQYGTNRGITTGNFFTSIKLADDLLLQGLTLTGTLRKNKREIPLQFLPSKEKTIHSSMFGFAEDKMLVSYVPKKNKAVLLLSTRFNDAEINNSEKQKPLIINHYNNTKTGVDTGDQMTREYSCSRSTRRWPFRLFMEIIDMAALNAYLLWIEKYPEWKQNNQSRRKHFIRELSLELAKPNILKRKNSDIVYHKQQEDAFNTVLAYCGESIPLETLENNTLLVPREVAKRGSCGFCSKKSRKRTRLLCNVCKKAVCLVHRIETKVISCTNCDGLSPQD